jgi:hypothetical protein
LKFPELTGKEQWNFPHLPTKNVVRYGAPDFVAGKIPETWFSGYMYGL